jgi:3',5'-cyclic AMP phosphodiesterase CpdA
MRFGRLTVLFVLLGPLAGLLPSARAEPEPVTVLAAGDIAFCERSLRRQLKDRRYGNSAEPGAPATAALLDRLSGTILVLGDLAYWRGTEAEFEDCYDPSWGRHKARSRPVPGNHEYRSPEAAPYFAYWGGRAGQPNKGYYSFDLGAWHLIALDSNLEGEAMAEQQAWLGRDLTASEARCILAYGHHPRFSSGKNRDQAQMGGLYRLLYEGGASLFLAGHDHNYERFAPMDPEGRLDPHRGIRGFVVGTGGGQLKAYGISDPPRANSEAVDGSTWGVLELTLYEDRYDWAFVPVEGGTFEDSGSADCVVRPSLP